MYVCQEWASKGYNAGFTCGSPRFYPSFTWSRLMHHASRSPTEVGSLQTGMCGSPFSPASMEVVCAPQSGASHQQEAGRLKPIVCAGQGSPTGNSQTECLSPLPQPKRTRGRLQVDRRAWHGNYGLAALSSSPISMQVLTGPSPWSPAAPWPS